MIRFAMPCDTNARSFDGSGAHYLLGHTHAPDFLVHLADLALLRRLQGDRPYEGKACLADPQDSWPQATSHPSCGLAQCDRMSCASYLVPLRGHCWWRWRKSGGGW